ncbi:MAG TPA: DUF72 domain-containing protein [Nitrospiraceae bacterium]|nr:DUF72 domain-containing protein [Nitrospiraceae bacterium]
MAPILSPLILLGTSTWTYEGWKGQVYNKPYPKGRFKQDCLAEYADYEFEGEKLFRTVGIDHSFYGPPPARQLAHYASLLPPGFQACAKVWEEITVPVYPSGLRYAKKSGANPHFLDAGYFMEQVVPPFAEAFQGHTGPFIFEFQRTGIEPKEFLPRLDQFLSRLPTDFEYAVEIRNPAVLGPEYHSILKAHGASHVYTHLYGMPAPEQQHGKLGETFTAPFVLLRLMTPLDKKYHDAVKAYQPYDKLVRPLPDMRRQAVSLVHRAVADQRRAYVLVNNRSEGNAPDTVKALYARLVGSQRDETR